MRVDAGQHQPFRSLAEVADPVPRPQGRSAVVSAEEPEAIRSGSAGQDVLPGFAMQVIRAGPSVEQIRALAGLEPVAPRGRPSAPPSRGRRGGRHTRQPPG
jgi:hypothetical protein